MWWITASYLFVKGRWSHLKVTQALVNVWQASKTSHTKSSLGIFLHQYVPGWIVVNVYSHHLLVKSVSCCCVHGSRLFSDLVTVYATCHQSLTLVSLLKVQHIGGTADLRRNLPSRTILLDPVVLFLSCKAPIWGEMYSLHVSVQQGNPLRPLLFYLVLADFFDQTLDFTPSKWQTDFIH